MAAFYDISAFPRPSALASRVFFSRGNETIGAPSSLPPSGEKHSCNLNGIGGPFFWSVPKSIEGKLGTMDTGHPLRLPAINAQKAFRSGTHLGSEAVRRTFFFPIYSFCEGNGDDGPIVKVQLNDEQTVDKSLST